MNNQTLPLLLSTAAIALVPWPFLTADARSDSPRTIAVTFAGSYERIVLQTQQLAARGDETPTWLDVGAAKVIENWIDSEETTPGVDGRPGHFTPPRKVLRGELVYTLVESLEEPTVSDGRRTDTHQLIPNAVAEGRPPEGYAWIGPVRVKTSSEIVTWRQDWQYRRVVDGAR